MNFERRNHPPALKSFREFVMKNFIFCCIASTLIACAPAQQVTVTFTPPIPTPTLHPEFAALQQTITDSGSLS